MTQTAGQFMKEALERIVNSHPLSVIVLGDFMLDRYIWGACNRISPEAPVPVVRVQSETNGLGGAGNVVANLHGLGVNALPVGVLGCDVAAEQVRTYLTEMGCSTDQLVEVSGRPTIEKTRVIAQNQQVVRIDREVTKPFEEETSAKLRVQAETALDVSAVCVISDYGKGVCQPKLLRHVIDMAQQLHIPVLVDPKSDDFSRYAGACCITPNLLETSRVTPLESMDDVAVAKAARTLREAYQFENVLITRGADGMTLFTRGDVVHIAAEAREVYDVSGAGDTVIATMAAALGSGLDSESAARLANAAAGVVVGKLGTVPITFTELQQVVHNQWCGFGQTQRPQGARLR
ncbi:D-glycero-beta-D-manno-heptose-7-phosphate kinase [Candidatus Poribacteria bacterium]|nr:D-glycero-beta-D-manno-heptose-7-phosphate kinase [Candidatus Poribacteria bacterium]